MENKGATCDQNGCVHTVVIQRTVDLKGISVLNVD